MLSLPAVWATAMVMTSRTLPAEGAAAMVMNTAWRPVPYFVRKLSRLPKNRTVRRLFSAKVPVRSGFTGGAPVSTRRIMKP